MLIDKQRVATNRRDCDPVQARPSWRASLETPVAVPVLGEQRCRLISATTNCDHMFATSDRGDKRIVTERPEAQREPLQIVVGHELIRKRQHVVLEPGSAYLTNLTIAERMTQIDPGDARST